VTARRDVERVLADPAFEVPVAPPGDGGLAWLRSTVSRFVNGAAHARRRALVEAGLAGLDPAALRLAARAGTEAVLAGGGARVEVMSAVARPVPLRTLGRALGVGDADLEAAVADAAVVAPAYASGAGDERVDAAADRLRGVLDRGDPEATAAAIAVLVQACEATASLIGCAVVVASGRPELRGDVDALVGETLRRAAPVRLMRRVSDRGAPVTLDLDAATRDSGPDDPPLTFGSGVRPCPGVPQAVALASGVLEALLPRCAPDPEVVTWADLPALRLPARLELTVG